jgi:N-acetylglutamate synthase-like GNAT family acetyltransferase
MAGTVQVRKARLKDAESIADFVNAARPDANVTRLSVAERFSQVGFILAEDDGKMVGMVGFQVENLVIRVTDFLISSAVDRVEAGQAMIAAMEAAGADLQAEASMLFLPANPSAALVEYWQAFGYERHTVADMHRAWREAASEWAPGKEEVMSKQLREDVTRKPM